MTPSGCERMFWIHTEVKDVRERERDLVMDLTPPQKSQKSKCKKNNLQKRADIDQTHCVCDFYLSGVDPPVLDLKLFNSKAFWLLCGVDESCLLTTKKMSLQLAVNHEIDNIQSDATSPSNICPLCLLIFPFFAIPPHFFGSFFVHPSTSDPLISLAIYHHLKVDICLNIQRNMGMNNMPLEDNYGERVHMCGNLYALFSVGRQSIQEKRIIYRSLSLCLQQLMHHWNRNFIVF